MSNCSSHETQKSEDCRQNNLIDKINLYRRLREHEDGVMNHRMVWMWTLQALLFAAFSVIWKEGDILPLVTICLVGLFSCISIGYSLYCSHNALEDMEVTGENKLKKDELIKNEPLQLILGCPPNKVIKCLLPWIMAGAWPFFIGLAIKYLFFPDIAKCLPKIAQQNASS